MMMVGCCSAVYGAPRPGTGMKRRAHGIGRHFALFIDLILFLFWWCFIVFSGLCPGPPFLWFTLTVLSICMHLHDAVAYGLGCARVSCFGGAS